MAAISVFIAMSTQWRVGPGGPYGLDYQALPVTLRLCEVPRQAWPDVFDEIRVMEIAALAEIRKA